MATGSRRWSTTGPQGGSEDPDAEQAENMTEGENLQDSEYLDCEFDRLPMIRTLSRRRSQGTRSGWSRRALDMVECVYMEDRVLGFRRSAEER